MMNMDDITKLKQTFGLPSALPVECEYQDVECDIRNEDMTCNLNNHPMEICPGEDEEDDDDDN
jgi:hypothetical protein